jgi:hypothetical protein
VIILSSFVLGNRYYPGSFKDMRLHAHSSSPVFANDLKAIADDGTSDPAMRELGL